MPEAIQLKLNRVMVISFVKDCQEGFFLMTVLFVKMWPSAETSYSTTI